MRCLTPYHDKKSGMFFPCGRCICCRINRREEWSMRLYHEHEYWKDACFVTLTYNDFYLPRNESGVPVLRPDDLQKFFKRLRRTLCRRISSQFRIKMFSCGEYGPSTHRPHYHAIIFGLDWTNPVHVQAIKDSWRFCDEHMWLPRYQRGRNRFPIGACTLETCRYVAGYVYKKAVNSDLERYVKDNQLRPCFQRQSQGLGKQWCLDNYDDWFKHAFIRCRGLHPIPRYYKKVKGVHNYNFPALLKQMPEIQRKRLEAYHADEKTKKAWLQTNYSYTEFLQQKNRFDAAQVEMRQLCDSLESGRLKFVPKSWLKSYEQVRSHVPREPLNSYEIEKERVWLQQFGS